MTFKTGNYRSSSPSDPGEPIPLTQVLPTGYEFRRALTGQLQIWRVDVTPEVLLSEQDVGILDVNGSIRAAVNTLYLEQAHAITSSGEEIAFKNLETGVNYMPAWAGATPGGVNLTPLSGLEEGPLVPDYEPGGAVLATGAVPAEYTSIVSANSTIFGVTFISAEAYTGPVSLIVRDSRNEIVFMKDLASTAYAVDGTITAPDVFYRVRIGNTRTVGFYKPDGTALSVRPSTSDNTKPYRKYSTRAFSDRKVVLVGADGKIPLSDLPELNTSIVLAVSTEAERLALLEADKLYVVTQSLAGPNSAAGYQWFLNPNTDPSIHANWIQGASVGTIVSTFAGRSGTVVPANGDYSAAQVGAVALPGADAVRRVLVGNIPTQESIADDLTTDSATAVLSARQGKILQDSKQATVSGGATSILNSNLTASRVLVSDGGGKVAVSTVTPTELGHLTGVTSNIQEQLDSYICSAVALWQANGAGSSSVSSYGGSFSVGGTPSSDSMASDGYGRVRKILYSVNSSGTVATVNGPAAYDTATGFSFCAVWGLDSGNIANMRAFVGLKASQITNAGLSTQFNLIGVGFDPNDTNLSIIQNNAAGAATKTDLGVNFPAATAGSVIYRLEMKCDPGSVTVVWKLTKLTGGTVQVATGTFNNTELPAVGTFCTPFISYMTTNSNTVRVGVSKLSIKTVM